VERENGRDSYERKMCEIGIMQDILGSIELSLITTSKRHLAPKHSGAASLEVAPTPSFLDLVS
jgi:hypothetical protein